MKKYWFQIVSLTLNIVLLVAVVRLYSAMENLHSQTGSRIDLMENRMETELSNVVSGIERAMEKADRLHTNYTLEPSRLDAKTKSLLADFSVELKEWSGDTAAVLLVRQNGSDTEVPLTHAGNGRFTAPVALTTENGDIWLSITVTAGGVTAKEDLGGWGDISMLLPLQMNGWGGSVPTIVGDQLMLGDYSAHVKDQDYNWAKAEDTEFYVYLNGENVLTCAAEPLEDFGMVQYESGSLPDLQVQEGDSVALSFACRDVYGLHYEFPMYSWTIERDQGNKGKLYIEETLEEDDSPILTWG